jgi:hypothetical protein
MRGLSQSALWILQICPQLEAMSMPELGEDKQEESTRLCGADRLLWTAHASDVGA